MSFALDKFREELHLSLINELRDIYGKQTWKYLFIKNTKRLHNIDVQYKQLNVFEEGGSRNENILNLMLLEILHHRNFNFRFKLDDVREISFLLDSN